MTLQEAVKEAIAEGKFSNRIELRDQVIAKLKASGEKASLTAVAKEIKSQLDGVSDTAEEAAGHQNAHATIFN